MARRIEELNVKVMEILFPKGLTPQDYQRAVQIISTVTLKAEAAINEARSEALQARVRREGGRYSSEEPTKRDSRDRDSEGDSEGDSRDEEEQGNGRRREAWDRAAYPPEKKRSVNNHVPEENS